MEAPRVLRLSFEFHVPQGLKANIRSEKVENAMARITGTVQGLAEVVFPWADRVTVRSEWLYAWVDNAEEIPLPATTMNTVA
jgi:hypothetical protein